MVSNARSKMNECFGVFLAFVALDLGLVYYGLGSTRAYYWLLGFALVGTYLTCEGAIKSFLTYKFIDPQRKDLTRGRVFEAASKGLDLEKDYLEVLGGAESWVSYLEEKNPDLSFSFYDPRGNQVDEEGYQLAQDPQPNLYGPGDPPPEEAFDYLLCNNLLGQAYPKGGLPLEDWEGYLKTNGQVLLLTTDENLAQVQGLDLLDQVDLKSKLSKGSLRRRGLDQGVLAIYEKNNKKE